MKGAEWASTTHLRNVHGRWCKTISAMRLGVRGGAFLVFLGMLMVLEISFGFLVAELGMSRVCWAAVGTALAERGERQCIGTSSIVRNGGTQDVGVDESRTPVVDSPLFRRFGNLKGKNVKTVSESIEDFCKLYNKPILPQFRTTVNEILVINHLYRVNARFQYNPVYAYGLHSTFFKLLSLYPGEGVPNQILDAIVRSINLDLKKFHKDIAKVENWMATSMTVESLAANLKVSNLSVRLVCISLSVVVFTSTLSVTIAG